MRRTSTLLILPFILLFLVLPLAADEDTGKTADEGRAVLERADAAIKAVHAVRYRATAQPSGAAESFFEPAEGRAVMIGWLPDQNMPHKFFVDLKTGEAGLTGGGDGDTYFLVDHGTKKAYEDMDPGVMGRTGRTLRRFGMLEFVHDAPFDDELGADVVELEDDEEIEGEECARVRVVYSGGRGESTWFFSRKDHLPRRRIQRFSTGQGDGALEITISRLEIDPEVAPNLFKLKLPEGYEQIDDFAP